MQKAIKDLIIKHKLTNLSEEPILHIHHIGFDYKENQGVCINFKDSNPITTKLDAIVRVCDEALLSRDGYRNLAAVVPELFREYLVADRRNKINEFMNSQIHIEIFNIDQNINQLNGYNNVLVVGNGAYRSLSTLLKVLIPIWKATVIIPGDTLHIKLGGDGRNVGRKQSHVMVTFCLLNEKDDVLKPNHQYRYIYYYV